MRVTLDMLRGNFVVFERHIVGHFPCGRIAIRSLYVMGYGGTRWLFADAHIGR